MPDLPLERVSDGPPFLHIGIDFAGSLYVSLKVMGYPLNNFMGANFYWPQNQLSYVLC